MTADPTNLLKSWLNRQLSPDAWNWLDQQLNILSKDPSSRTFDILFGMIPRKLGKDDLKLSDADLSAAQAARSGWNPARWSVDVAARVLALALVSRQTGSNQSFPERFKELHRTADLGELLALYHGLPVYEGAQGLVELAALGLRTNIRAEFEAIAHHNPFPAEQFEQNPWNNMVLKALFIGAMLEPIQGLDERANADLARILRDYAHERWAADRAVSPELWRCIGPFAEGEVLDDFQRVIDTGNKTERKAVAFALRMAPKSERQKEVADQLAEFDVALDEGAITWASIADEMFDNALAITRKLNTEVELTR